MVEHMKATLVGQPFRNQKGLEYQVKFEERSRSLGAWEAECTRLDLCRYSMTPFELTLNAWLTRLPTREAGECGFKVAQ